MTGSTYPSTAAVKLAPKVSPPSGSRISVVSAKRAVDDTCLARGLLLSELIPHRRSRRAVCPVVQVSYEVARVLKPGGVYLLTDYRDPERVQELFEREEWEGGSLT